MYRVPKWEKTDHKTLNIQTKCAILQTSTTSKYTPQTNTQMCQTPSPKTAKCQWNRSWQTMGIKDWLSHRLSMVMGIRIISTHSLNILNMYILNIKPMVNSIWYRVSKNRKVATLTIHQMVREMDSWEGWYKAWKRARTITTTLIHKQTTIKTWTICQTHKQIYFPRTNPHRNQPHTEQTPTQAWTQTHGTMQTNHQNSQ